MGWFGNYRGVDEVVEEKRRSWDSKYEILEVKARKAYASMLVKEKGSEKLYIEYFIFRNDMYKNIDWFDPMHISRTPKKWINKIYPQLDNYEKKWVDEYIQKLEEKKKIPKLSDILEKGKTYKIFDKYMATYSHKENRTYLFWYEGRMTKFVGLKPEHVKEATEKIA